jgi:hypothetical protein
MNSVIREKENPLGVWIFDIRSAQALSEPGSALRELREGS